MLPTARWVLMGRGAGTAVGGPEWQSREKALRGG